MPCQDRSNERTNSGSPMNVTLQVDANGRITLPAKLRDALHLHAGDLLRWELNDSDSALVRRLPSREDPYLSAVSDTLAEWNSPEDEEAWRDL